MKSIFLKWIATAQYAETASTKLWAENKGTQKKQPSHLTISMETVISANQILSLNLQFKLANKFFFRKETRKVYDIFIFFQKLKIAPNILHLWSQITNIHYLQFREENQHRNDRYSEQNKNQQNNQKPKQYIEAKFALCKTHWKMMKTQSLSENTEARTLWGM